MAIITDKIKKDTGLENLIEVTWNDKQNFYEHNGQKVDLNSINTPRRIELRYETNFSWWDNDGPNGGSLVQGEATLQSASLYIPDNIKANATHYCLGNVSNNGPERATEEGRKYFNEHASLMFFRRQ